MINDRLDAIKQIIAELNEESDERYRKELRRIGLPEDRVEAAVEARNGYVKEAMRTVVEYLIHGEQPVIERDVKETK